MEIDLLKRMITNTIRDEDIIDFLYDMCNVSIC